VRLLEKIGLRKLHMAASLRKQLIMGGGFDSLHPLAVPWRVDNGSALVGSHLATLPWLAI